ncbi:hypothetical protein [Nonomuraea sp. NPDC049504]|uniref:hypothetical protein n=1 Tax=Nonomuraea sp. NPDC049504 TaxID=3154729 RepID=UPI0034397BBD
MQSTLATRLVGPVVAARVPAGADAVTGTLEDLPGALSGIHTVFLIWPFLTTEGAPAVVETIARHTRRLVYLSSTGVGGDEERDDPIFRMHAGMERLIEQSGLPSAIPTA